MSKQLQQPVKYELIESRDSDSDSSEELLSRRFDLDDGRGIITKTYDPYDYSCAEHPTSYLETFTNFFKALVGIGIFSLPAAFAQVGYITGSIGLVICTYLSVYSEKILIATEYTLCKRRHIPCMNFQETVEAAFKDGPHKFSGFAPKMKWLSKFLISIVTFGSACVYNLVIAQNTKAILDPLIGITDVRLYLIYFLIPLVLINLVRSLKYIARVSILSNVIITFTIISVLVFVFKSPSSLQKGKAFGDWMTLPMFAGTVFFSISSITLVLPLKNEMREPYHFAGWNGGVLFTGSAAVGLLSWIFGVAGYLKYGDDIQGSITLNLPKDHLIPKLVQGGLALAIFLSTPINNYILFDILVDDFLSKVDGIRKKLGAYIIHAVIVVVSVAISCAIPNLTLLVSFIGVGANAILNMTIPATIHLMTVSNISITSKITDYFIIILSFVFIITGTFENVKSMIKLYTT